MDIIFKSRRTNIPERFRETEIPVLCHIRPSRVVARDWTTSSAKHT